MQRYHNKKGEKGRKKKSMFDGSRKTEKENITKVFKCVDVNHVP